MNILLSTPQILEYKSSTIYFKFLFIPYIRENFMQVTRVIPILTATFYLILGNI